MTEFPMKPKKNGRKRPTDRSAQPQRRSSFVDEQQDTLSDAEIRRTRPRQSTASDFSSTWRRIPPKKRQQLLLIAGGALLALILVIFLLVSLLGKSAENPQSEFIPSSLSASEAAVDKDYNKDANKLDTDQLGGTILAETEDAGQDYIDETLFIGDSNTARMMSYGLTTLDNDIGTVSMGIQHVLTKKCAFFKGYENGVTIPQAVKLMQPRRIIITFGTNNTIGWSADTFAEQYQKALSAIHDAYPYADIIINSIPPVHQYRENPNVTMQTIDSFNKALAQLAKNEGYKFLNSAEVLKDEKTGFAKWDYTITDGIHLNKDAMTVLFDYIRTHAYITEDSRPALKAVPARLETPYDIITSDPLAVHAESTPKPSATPSKGEYTVTYQVNDKTFGSLTGETEQFLNIGDTATKVKAVPATGYVFSHWAINVGSIDPTKAEVEFTLRLNTEKKIVLTAYFVKAATPSPTPTVSPTPTPTASPTPSPSPSVSPSPSPAPSTPPSPSTSPSQPPAHSHSYASSDTTLPTCTTAGVRTFTCSCGDTYQEPIPALGHAWGEWVDNGDGNHTRTCTRGCGATETEPIPAP